MEGEGSSARGPTAFETIIHPDQEPIEVSHQFATNWKDIIALANIGSIKDPAGNFFEIDTNTILTDFTIYAGQTIAYHCGFNQPQKVILDYQPDFNQFDMRIIDDEGRDILYLGFHNPVNDHALKLANPNHEVNPQFISKIRKGGKMFIPIGFAMNWMGLAEAINNAHNAGDQNANEVGDEEDDVEEEESQDEEEEGTHPFEWFCDVSAAIAHGRSVLHFPKWVGGSANISAGLDITLINNETNERAECKVKRSARNPPEYFIGKGWYAFVLNMNLNVGDQLLFGLEDPPACLHVGVLRAVHPAGDD